MIFRRRKEAVPFGSRGRPWPREREGPAPSGVGGMSGAKDTEGNSLFSETRKVVTNVKSVPRGTNEEGREARGF